MAKNIRWKIPFVSLSGIHYRIDIYDEGTFTPVTLTGGTNPFTTSEDDSDDYFAPIRTQTGTIEVCTLMPDGNYITLDDLLPANNIARPVRLMNLDTTPSPTIEWQGFLSCEAYDQDYTSIPQILQLPVISVLEAMASVQLDQTRSSGLQPVYVSLPAILKEIDRQSGITCFTHLNYSRTDYRIISKYIDMTVMFEQKEYNNENSTTYIVSGLSAKDALERLCTYMGWIAREKGTEIYLQRIGEEIGMFREEIDEFPGVAQDENITEAGIAATFADKWRGTDHKRTVSQGAKSVEVVAKLETSDFGLKIPQFPFGDTSPLEWHNGMKYKSSTFKYFYIQINYNNEAYNNNAYSYHQGEITRTGDSDYTATYLGTSTQSDFIARLSLFPHINQKYISSNPQVAGAILIRYAIEDTQVNNPQLKEGLYCPLLPGQNGKDYPIYKMWTVKKHTFFNGKFVINAAMLFNALNRYSGALNQQIMSDNIGDSYVNCQGEEMTFALRVGNMYWDGTSWGSTRKTFQIPLLDKGIECEIEANQHLSGDVELEVMAGVTVTHINTLYEVIFNSLEVGFKLNEDYQASDRSENHYFRLLGTNFRDEISINTELASNLNNMPSPSLIMNSETEAMTELNYGTDQVPDMRRPEVDLLNRLATYYGAARQRLSLIVAHPTVAPLPILRLNGISPDNRKYLPLAESRDWQEETCTLTCFETPTE